MKTTKPGKRPSTLSSAVGRALRRSARVARFEGEARMALAMKLFEMGRLTSGQAAQLAGGSRVAFLLSCPQWNVPSVVWDAAGVSAEFKPLPA